MKALARRFDVSQIIQTIHHNALNMLYIATNLANYAFLHGISYMAKNTLQFKFTAKIRIVKTIHAKHLEYIASTYTNLIRNLVFVH